MAENKLKDLLVNCLFYRTKSLRVQLLIDNFKIGN